MKRRVSECFVIAIFAITLVRSINIKVFAFEDSFLLTSAHRNKAIKQMLEEANIVAQNLCLEDHLPIEEKDLRAAFVVPDSISASYPKSLGSISTMNYAYNFPRNHQLCSVERSDQNTRFAERVANTILLSQVNTNFVLDKAEEYFVKANVDVARMQKELIKAIVPDPTYNSYNSDTNRVVTMFLVTFKTKRQVESGGSVAYARLMLPTCALISLVVKEPEYILPRKVLPKHSEPCEAVPPKSPPCSRDY